MARPLTITVLVNTLQLLCRVRHWPIFVAGGDIELRLIRLKLLLYKGLPVQLRIHPPIIPHLLCEGLFTTM